MTAIRSTPAKSVDAYLKLVPEAMRVALQKLRKIIKAAARPRQLSWCPICFKPGKPLPAALVTKLVKERIAENEKSEKVRQSRRLFFSSCRVGLCSPSGPLFLVRSRRF